MADDKKKDQDEDKDAVAADEAERKQSDPEVKGLQNLEKSLKRIEVDDSITKKEL